MNHSLRQLGIKTELPRHGLDALWVAHPPNLRYLCGFTGSSGILLLTESQSVFFTDGRYIVQSREEVKSARIVIARKSPIVSAVEWLQRRKAANFTLGVEGEHLTVSGRSRLAKLLGAGFRLKEAPPLVEVARIVKDDEEIGLLRSAVRMGSDLFKTILWNAKTGVSENAVAAELEYAARRAGAQQMSFATIIASGKRSALPHGVASGAELPARGFVVCDFGVILAGYCSDMTRTIHVGKPTVEARQVYESVREAQQAAVEAVKPGISASEVDSAARKFLTKRRLGKYFTHSTGHGVGLEIHEAPRLAAGQVDVLRVGMVITIEPGVYIPGRFGIRIEDTILVTETGSEVLTPTTKELITL